MFQEFGQFVVNVFAIFGAFVALVFIFGFIGTRIMGAGDKPDSLTPKVDPLRHVK
jgi:hypothetical protein